jgi:hypothetical protein
VEQEWEQIKSAIIEAANEVIQTQSKKERNEWWDEDCQLAIPKKNEARRKWLQHRTRASNEWYHKKRNEANRMCATKKKEWINKTIGQIEENHKRKEPRKFFNEIKHLRQQNTGLPHICKDGNNTVITQTNKILNRWKEYFCTILN